MVKLRFVEPGDVEAYIRMRCDPVMMAELGGPLPVEEIAAKVGRDVADAAADRSWNMMIVPDPADQADLPEPAGPDSVAGIVALWAHDDGSGLVSEIGWMVLPDFQGRGMARQAARLLLDRAIADGRWGVVHAYPGYTNGPSNAICRLLGFTLVGKQDVEFAGRVLPANHWQIDLSSTGTA